MAKYRPGYDFRSSDFHSQPDRWQQQGRQASAPAPPVPDEGQRPCARDLWCASSVIVTEDGKQVRRPALGYQSFCPRDREHIARCLDELPGLYVRLHAELGQKGTATGERVRMSKSAPIPLSVSIDALMRSITESLYSWHERVAAVACLSFPSADLSRRRRDGLAVDRAVTVLGGHLDALLALGPEDMWRTRPEGRVIEELDGAAAGLEVLHIHYRCRSVLGETRAKPEELIGIPCRADGCGIRGLRRCDPPSDSDDPGYWSECTACGDRMNEADYREWTALCAAYERNRVKVPAALENLPGVA